MRRLFVSLENFDAATAERAWGDFQPAVPTTVEAFVVGGAAYVLGWLATHLTFWPARRRAAQRRLARA